LRAAPVTMKRRNAFQSISEKCGVRIDGVQGSRVPGCRSHAKMLNGVAHKSEGYDENPNAAARIQIPWSREGGPSDLPCVRGPALLIRSSTVQSRQGASRWSCGRETGRECQSLGIRRKSGGGAGTRGVRAVPSLPASTRSTRRASACSTGSTQVHRWLLQEPSENRPTKQFCCSGLL
jgi:hypothetical protein